MLCRCKLVGSRPTRKKELAGLKRSSQLTTMAESWTSWRLMRLQGRPQEGTGSIPQGWRWSCLSLTSSTME